MSAPLRRIAVGTADVQGLDGAVSAHFGHCAAFTLITLDANRVVSHEVVQNPFAEHHEPGAVPGYLAGLGVDAVLSGGMGRRALALFAERGIAASTGHAGTVREAVQAWLQGGGGTEPCPGHGGHGGHGHGPGGCEGTDHPPAG